MNARKDGKGESTQQKAANNASRNRRNRTDELTSGRMEHPPRNVACPSEGRTPHVTKHRLEVGELVQKCKVSVECPRWEGSALTSPAALVINLTICQPNNDTMYPAVFLD